ncbi:MAG: sugar phosphate isomerase/epimerase [Sphaerochaetaceae bacterium]|nr:sugar phosphate isomerase/epimerase [Sphaerochaetaceae bacterium]
MSRPVTLFTGQWADLPFETICEKAAQFGYDGLEIACWGDHMDVRKAATDSAYCDERKAILKKNGLSVWALGAHLSGQCVGDLWDPRLDGFAPAELAGQPEKIRAWAIEEMKYTAQAAHNMGCEIVTGFMGSPVWKYWYSFPQTSEKMIDDAFKEIVDLWSPIFDEFDRQNVRFALEVHPTEIAFDYYTAERLLEEFKFRDTLGFNFDPSHLIWQGVTPHIFLRDFIDKVYHVHMKDAAVTLDGKAGILGSHIEFGDTRRGWNFRSLGHGDVDFENIIRELNAGGYQGPLSVEWEDSGMEREYGAKEACEFVRAVDFAPSNLAFDDAMKQ